MPRAPKKIARTSRKLRSQSQKKEQPQAVVKSGGTKSRKLVIKPAPPPIGLPSPKKKEVKVNVKGRKTKPSYVKMIKEAIRSNPANNIHGASRAYIANFIRTNYPVPLDSYNRRIKVALAKAVEDGILEKLGVGRYKISKAERARDYRKRNKKRGSKKVKSEEEGEQQEQEQVKKQRSPKKAGSEKSKKQSKKESSSKPRKATEKGVNVKKSASPSKRTQKEGASAAASGETKWVWQYYDHGWYNYDFQASDIVEAVYQDYLKNPGKTDVRSVASGEWEYMVDFRQMMQQNLRHPAHTKRRIRRVQLPVEEIEQLRYNPRAKCYPDEM